MTTPSAKLPVNIEDEMKRSYLDYAMSVIIGRALPDVRDGLKPAHRRVLYGMRTMGLASNRGYRKCAKIVGEVMGNFHPHGDAAIYDTLVRLSQDFNMRYPLVDGQGNFGSLDGDPPAAMRYTEARLMPLAEEMMADLDKETVERLAALGYVGAPVAAKTAAAKGQATLADPKDKLQVFNFVTRAGEMVLKEQYAEAKGLLEQALHEEPGIPQALLLLATTTGTRMSAARPNRRSRS